jgi:hypothetical protein
MQIEQCATPTSKPTNSQGEVSKVREPRGTDEQTKVLLCSWKTPSSTMDKEKRSRHQVLVKSIASSIIGKSLNTQTGWGSQTSRVVPKRLISLPAGSVFRKLSTGQSSAPRVWNSYVNGIVRREILDTEGLSGKQKIGSLSHTVV